MMKLLLVFLSSILLLTVSLQSKEADVSYANAMREYERGNYYHAKTLFQGCLEKYSSKYLDASNCQTMIDKCNIEIGKIQKAKKEEELRARQAAAAEKEALEKKIQKRIEDNLIYISSEAYLFDKKFDLHSVVRGAFSRSGFKMTNDPDAARWSIILTAFAYSSGEERKYLWEGEKIWYYSSVNARYLIQDEITGEIIYEDEILDVGEDMDDHSTENHEAAARKVYADMKMKIGDEIVNNFKLHKQ